MKHVMEYIKRKIEGMIIILSAFFCMFSAVVPASANTTGYGLTDHLGNVRAVVAEDGSDAGAGIDILSATDYYPGGMRLPNRWYISENYRFGYQGQFAEKDPETGYNQFEARLYDARILRWNTTDPAGQYFSPYLAMGNNWISTIDPDGRDDVYYNADGTYSHTVERSWFRELFTGKWSHFIEDANGLGYTEVSYDAFMNWQSDLYPQGWGAKAIDWKFTPQGHEINPVDGSILRGGALENVYPEAFLVIPARSLIKAGLNTAAESGAQGFKSLGAAGNNFSKVLQSGGQSLTPKTLNALKLTKEQGRNAIHALKSELRLPNNFHGKIMGNGDYLHPSTGEWLGNLFDYVY